MRDIVEFAKSRIAISGEKLSDLELTEAASSLVSEVSAEVSAEAATEAAMEASSEAAAEAATESSAGFGASRYFR